jgi:hypothetical protein
VPDWISWRDQGAAIAVFDITGDGNPDLFVFHIDDFHTDNPNHPNKGFYRIATGLTVNGGVSNWGDWIEVDWFSWFNQQGQWRGAPNATNRNLNGVRAQGSEELVSCPVRRWRWRFF